jgi:DNA-binding transcriptional MerR regulator
MKTASASAATRAGSRSTRNAENPKAEHGFTSFDITRIFPVTLRQLQWWDERNVVSPVHEGHKRMYGYEDAILLGIVHRLKECGMSLQRIRRMLNGIGRMLNWTPLPAYLLITTGPMESFKQGEEADLVKAACSVKSAHLVSLDAITDSIACYKKPAWRKKG